MLMISCFVILSAHRINQLAPIQPMVKPEKNREMKKIMVLVINRHVQMGKEDKTSQQHLLIDPLGLQRLNFALIFFPL